MEVLSSRYINMASNSKDMIDIVGGRDQLNKIRMSIVRSGVMETSSDSIENFFQEQLDNKIDRAERAKRIDERLQDFDTDYDVRWNNSKK